MRVQQRLTVHNVRLLVGALLAAAGIFSAFTIWTSAAKAQEPTTGHLVTVHDRGTETAFLTDKETLKDAFAAAGIEVDSRDAVEPALDEKLVAKDYQVNIYRARPVTVVDGATRQKVITPYQTVERIAKDAGISLYPEDTATLSLSNNILDGAGLQLSIDRASAFTFELYGVSSTVRSQAETVGDMLKEKDITLGENGRVSPAASTPLTAGMNVRVWQEGKQTVTVEEPVAFTTEQIKDADRLVGYKQVQTAGTNGSRSVTYEIEIINGAETSRKEIASVALVAAVKQVEVIGSKPNVLPYTGGGSKSDWLAASSIPQESWGYADFMVTKESGWNPNSVNKSSGACGLAQALPCSKVPGNPYDPVDSLNWMNGYVNGRYGGWAGAYAFWQKNHWY